MKRLMIAFALIGSASSMALGFAPQCKDELSTNPKMTRAYELLVLRKVSVETALFDLSSRFTSDSSQVRTKSFELSVVNREMKQMQRMKRAHIPKLSVTYGNLLLRKVDLEVELDAMRELFTSQHHDVKTKSAELSLLANEIEMMLK